MFRVAFGVGVAILVSVFLTVSIMRDNQIAGCERTNEFKKTVISHVEGDGISGNDPKVIKKIKATIPNCREAYPPLIPIME